MRQYDYFPEAYIMGRDPIHDEFAVIGAYPGASLKALSLAAAIMSGAVKEDDIAEWGLIFEWESSHAEQAQSILRGESGEDIFIIRRELRTAVERY